MTLKTDLATTLTLLLPINLKNSYSPLNTFSTDDYFGYLDDDEGLSFKVI